MDAWTVPDWISSHGVVDFFLQVAALAVCAVIIGGAILWVMYVSCHVKHWQEFFKRPPAFRPFKVGGVSFDTVDVDSKQQRVMIDQAARLDEAENQLLGLLERVEVIESKIDRLST